MPAEWARHEATWLAWPHDPVTWSDRIPEVESTFAEMAAELAKGERVEILVTSRTAASRAAWALWSRGATNVRLRALATADSWMRDYGPTVLIGRGRARAARAFVRWRFNAWGGKYKTLLKDDGIPDRLKLKMPRFAPGIVLEGGSIDVDGAGTVLTTEQCLLNKNRNPHLNRAEIEAYLRAYLGVKNVLWLGDGIVGDDTDGHVDDIARFVAPRTVLAAYEGDAKDENFAPLHDNWRRLSAMTDAHGRPLTIVKLPMPGRLMAGKRRLPASYANFYIGNRVVLLPVYGHKNDAKAARIVRRLFPTRRVVPLDCRALVFGCGSIHCVTQQLPA